MVTEKSADYLVIKLEEEDFQKVDKYGRFIWKLVIRDLKKIPGWEYRDTEEIWLVHSKYEKRIKRIYEKYLRDEQQRSLFEDTANISR